MTLRYWLLTWTTYGTWLPGDRRGFVSPVRTVTGELELHNIPGTPIDADMPRLREHARSKMRGSPIWLTKAQAEVILAQLQVTATYRRDELLAVAIMANHVHVVVADAEARAASEILGDLKSYASRALNAEFGKPPGGTWWTESGSKRHLPRSQAVEMAIDYVRQQAAPLLVWIPPANNNEREA